MEQACIYMVNLTNIHSLSYIIHSDDALSAGAAAGVALSVIVLTAIITAIIVLLIIYFVFGCRSQSKYSPKNV